MGRIFGFGPFHTSALEDQRVLGEQRGCSSSVASMQGGMKGIDAAASSAVAESSLACAAFGAGSCAETGAANTAITANAPTAADRIASTAQSIFSRTKPIIPAGL